MQELNEESQPGCGKYEEIDRPFKFGNYGKMMYPQHDYGWKKYGPKWGYGYNYPYGGYGPYFPGTYYYGLPWLLLGLKGLSPRDVMKYMNDID